MDWTGNSGTGTKSYTGYDRSYTLSIADKPVIHGSSDPAFRGDVMKHNPEDLFVASVASCHMLWYLHLCTVNGITVVAYHDETVGVMIENKDGSGEFSEVCLRPHVVIKEADKLDRAMALHGDVSGLCFIARSVKCKITHEPKVIVK